MKVKRLKVLALGYGRGTVWAREGKLGVSFLHIYTEEGVQREVVLRAETPEEAVEEALGGTTRASAAPGPQVES